MKEEEVVSAQLEPGDCADLCGEREFQSPQTPRQGWRQSVRGNRMLAPRRAVPEAKAGLPCFYRFFFVSFFGLLLAGGMAALGFLSISALLGSDCSASCVAIFKKRESCLEELTLTKGILPTEAYPKTQGNDCYPD